MEPYLYAAFSVVGGAGVWRGLERVSGFHYTGWFVLFAALLFGHYGWDKRELDAGGALEMGMVLSDKVHERLLKGVLQNWSWSPL